MKKVINVLKVLLFLIICFFGFTYIVYDYVYPLNYKEEIEECADKYNLDKYEVYAFVNVESGFDKDAHSKADARGLMQIREITASWASENTSIKIEKEKDYFEPKTNLEIGCWYLAKLSEVYDNDLTKVAIAYNAGMGNLDKWIDEGYDVTNGDIPFDETEKYVEKIKSNYDVYKVLYGEENSKDDIINAFSKICDLLKEKIISRTNSMIKNKVKK